MKRDDLLDKIGEAGDEFIHEAKADRQKKTPSIGRWAKWMSAIAASLMLVLGGVYLLNHIGGKSGDGGDNNLSYMNYIGPVLPLSAQGNLSEVNAIRNIDFDFEVYYEEIKLAEVGTVARITDSYTLKNSSAENQNLTLFYPWIGNLNDRRHYPDFSVNGQVISPALNPGQDFNSYEWLQVGKERKEKGTSVSLSNFAEYQTLLGDKHYFHSAFDEFPAMDIPVAVYKLHDYEYSRNKEAVNPTLSMNFQIDFHKTYVFSYGMNGITMNDDGTCSRTKGGIYYQPDRDKRNQSPEDAYVIVVGEDLKNYTIQGYTDGSCDDGKELNDLGCTVTRFESTLGEIILELLRVDRNKRALAEEEIMTEKTKVPEVSLELYHNLVAELLDAYGWLGEFPIKRYDEGVLEDIFSAVLHRSRIIYFTFEVSIPAGQSIQVDAAMFRQGSQDYIGKNKKRRGYDLATELGTELSFTKQSATISGYDEIEIVNQNFGFDLATGITKVELDLNKPHYYLEVRKR